MHMYEVVVRYLLLAQTFSYSSKIYKSSENVPWTSSGNEWVWNEDVEEDGLAGGAAPGKEGRRKCGTYCHGCQGGSQW